MTTNPPTTDVPDAPEHLSERAQMLWIGTVADNAFGPHQLELLRRALEASDRADEARERLKAEGLTTTDRYGQLKPHPAVNIERDARLAEARLIRDLAIEPGVPEESRPVRIGAGGTGRR